MTPEQWDQLVAAFGDMSQQVYQAAARQAAIEAWMSFGLTLVTVAVFVSGMMWGMRLAKDDSDWFVPVLAFEVIVGLLGFLGLSYWVPTFFTYWVNPEWSVLRTLAGLVR